MVWLLFNDHYLPFTLMNEFAIESVHLDRSRNYLKLFGRYALQGL